MACNVDKRSLIPKDNDALELGSVGYDLPFESDRKEKFKMVIGKAKKDMNDPPSKASQQEYGISVDAAAAAAILQAATRGIRNPDLGILSVAVNGSSIVGRGSNSKSQASSELNKIVQMSDQGGRCNSSLAQTAKGVVIGSPAMEESSEAHLSREQKLKAERLKRAKMFVAKLKTGSGPSAAEPSQTLSPEPIESGALGAGAEIDNIEKVKEVSSTLVDSCIPDEIEDAGKNFFGDGERRLRRKYRLRSERHEVDDESDNEEDADDRRIEKKHRSDGSSHEGKGGKEKDEEEGTKKSSKRKHRPHYSSDEKDERKEKSHKHYRKRNQTRHPSHDDEDGGTNYHKHSRKKHSSHRSSHEEEDDREDSEDENYHKHSRKKHQSHRDSHKHTKESHRRRSKHETSDDDTDHSHNKHRKESHRRRSKHESSDTDREHSHNKHKKESHRRSKHKSEHLEKEDLEEGEISSKLSDQSRGSGTGCGNRDILLDNGNTLPIASPQPSETTDVPDDLRAKIRAMLMATR